MIVGLTGGIGSGKSTIATIFKQLRIPVYEADLASKEIIDTDKELQRELMDLLGVRVIEDGKINRRYMADKIFNNKVLLNEVNSLIHPAVAKDFKKWVSKHHSPYVIKEAAILFESGSYKECDKIIVVSAPKEMRIERVMKRNSISREEVEARIKNQWPEARKVEKADYIIYNDLSQSIIKQIITVNEDLIRQSNSRS